MKPLFQVGEEVILQSKGHPELNGEYTVYDTVKPQDVYVCRITGKNILSSYEGGGVGYRLAELVIDVKLNEEITIENLWNESALKKKHKPSDKSFSEMMTKLKGKVKA